MGDNPTVPDRYRRLALLGQGGAGQVWLVEDQLRPGAHLALKELTEDSGGRRADALCREFAMLARLRHPGLVEAHDLDPSPADGLPRFTLEHVEGKELATAVAAEGPQLLLAMSAEALRVLAFLHEFGLIHRDLKPANLLVRNRPRLGCRLVLLDLGLATPGAGGSDDSALAGPVGTLPYLAPELFDGSSATARSDLYSLGTLLYETVHGRPPYVVGDREIGEFVDLVREGRRSRPKLPEGFHPGLAPWLEELLSPDPSLRPGNALEALARLNSACETSWPLETRMIRAARLASDPPAARDDAFEELWSLLDPERGPRIVWLTGPAGGGKSRVLRWLHTEAILRGWQVLASRPGVPLLSPSGGAVGSEPLLARLRERAAAGPTLLLLDEVEHADGRVIRLLDRLATEASAEPVQVVAALRPGEVGGGVLRRLLGETGTVPTLRRVDLSSLDANAIRALAERALGGGELSETRLRWLAKNSDGNPAMAEALLVEGAWERGGRGRPSGALERSVHSRLEMLSESGRRWIESLAVLGSDVPEAAVATLAGLSEPSARDASEEARAAGMARVDRGRWSTDSRSVAELVRDRLRGRRHRDIHCRAAELLVSLGPGEARPWRLARLWSAAGIPASARQCARQAAVELLREGEPAEAAERFAFALRHCDRRDPARLELRMEQAAALMSAGSHAAAVRAYGACRRLCTDRRQLCDLMGRQAHALVQAGRFARARSVAEDALALASDEFPMERARARKAVGMLLGRLGRETEALSTLSESLAIFREAGDLETQAETLQNLAACKARLHRDDAERDFLQAIELYRQLGRSGSELRSLLGLAAIQMREGRLERAGQIFEDVRDKALRHGHLDLLETALSKLASLAIERGHLDRALALSREARDQALRLGDQNRIMVGACRVAEALIGCGRPAEAVDLLRERLEASLDQVEPDMIDSARMLLAQALLEMPAALEDDIRVPLDRSLEGFRERRKTRPLLMALSIELERRARRPDGDSAEAVLKEIDALIAHSGATPEPEIRIRRELARGLCQQQRGDPEAAREAGTLAAAIAREAGLPDYEARARGLVGQALDRLGDADQAATEFSAAFELLETAAARIEDPDIADSFRGRPVFRTIRERPEDRGQNERRLLALYDMIRALNTEKDPEALLESILDMALRGVSAERGMILLREDHDADAFSVRIARNLETETEQDAESYSRGIVARAGEGRSILALDAGKDDRFKDLQSVSLYGIHSLMCVPLRSGDRIIGTVYLDSRSSRTLMTPEDLRFIEAFADHAALALQNAREHEALVRENRRLQSAAERRVRFGNLIGRSLPMQEVFELIEKVAGSALPVLVQGESGTGKELVARAIHFNGRRRTEAFLSENCAAIPESLLESELFGHVRGAFTGAERDRQGLFEQADAGTLFLDEVGDMSPGMQARLLRVVQDGEVRRVGGDRSVRVDVRLIAATHRDLATEVESGRFREDLFYRLKVLSIRLPPLRERPEDVPPLIDHFLERIASERGRPAPRVSQDARHLLERHAWPGNVRQLENTLQRLALLAGDGPIDRALLESDESCRRELLADDDRGETPTYSFRKAAHEQLRRALTAAGGNRERAARLLGVSRATIYRKIREANLGDFR